MIYPFTRRLLAVTVILTALSRVSEGALVPLDLEKLTARSRFVVCGEVVGLRSFWGQLGKAGEVLFTDVRIRVSEVWKRPLERSQPGEIKEITVRLLGGQIGERWQRCVESPRFEQGEKVLVFARLWQGSLWVTGWRQGKYRLTGKGTALQVEGKPHRPLSRPEPITRVRERVRALMERAASRPAGSRDSEGDSTPRGKDSTHAKGVR